MVQGLKPPLGSGNTEKRLPHLPTMSAPWAGLTGAGRGGLRADCEQQKCRAHSPFGVVPATESTVRDGGGKGDLGRDPQKNLGLLGGEGAVGDEP